MGHLDWMRAVVGAICGIAVVGAGAAGAVDTKSDDGLFSFRNDIFERGADGIGLKSPVVSCERPLTDYGYDTPETFYFAGEGNTGAAQLWALAGFDFTDLGQLWVGQPFSYDITIPPTAEWGWVYDRNGDGRIDWMSYVESTVYYVPEEGVPDELALAAGGELLSDAVRITFIHTVDADFDGRPDHMIGVPSEVESGWGEGAMMISLDDGNGGSDCTWHSDYRRADDRACVARDGSFVTVGPGPVRERAFPVEGLVAYFDLLNSVVGDCGYRPGEVAARP